MKYTDENIPINCSICDHLVEGTNSIFLHILDIHSEYSPTEAAKYAQIWADGAFDDMERTMQRLTEANQ